MAQARLSMRKIREVLRLRAEGFTGGQIARSVGCARSSVQFCLWRWRATIKTFSRNL